MSRVMINRIISLIFLSSALFGCTPGLFTRMDSTAPSLGPIFIGTSREDAERHVGPPILTMPLDSGPYVNVYEYGIERSIADTISTDIMDYWTAGLGTLIISPMDRFERTRHLIAITYKRENRNKEQMNDRVIAITNRLINNPYAIHASEKSFYSLQKGEWDEAIRLASAAISLDPQLASAYINRAWAYSEKGLYDNAIGDCNKALRITPKNALAYNNRGLAYHRKGEIGKAVKDYKKACKLGLGIACVNLRGITETQASTRRHSAPYQLAK